MSNSLPWKIWMPDDLAPPSQAFEPLFPSDTDSDGAEQPEESEPDLQQQLAQLQIQAHEQGHQLGYAAGGRRCRRRPQSGFPAGPGARPC